MNARGIDFTGIAYLAVIGAAVYIGYRIVKAVPSGATVGQAVRDAIQNNPVNNAVSSVVQKLTGDSSGSETLGTWAAGVINPTTRAAADSVARNPAVYVQPDQNDVDDADQRRFGAPFAFGVKSDAPYLDFSAMLRRPRNAPVLSEFEQ